MFDEFLLEQNEALRYVLAHYNLSKYALAKVLSTEQTQIQPIQIDRFLAGAKMSRELCHIFFFNFDIIIKSKHLII